MTASDPGARRRRRTAWVLGGGGNLGSIQVGMLRALADRGEVPDAVFGCSVGALNGLSVAADPSPAGVERLRQTWLELDQATVFPSSRVSGPWMLLRRRPSLYPDDGLRDLIRRFAAFERIEDHPIRFECVATDLHSGRARWFDEGPLERAVLASCALPAAFPPVTIDGATYIDGAVVDNVPISRALHHGFERVVVLHIGNFDRPRPVPKRPIDVLLQSFSITRNQRFVHEAASPPPGVELVVLPGVDPGPVKRTDFTRAGELIERGHAAAAAHLDLLARSASA